MSAHPKRTPRAKAQRKRRPLTGQTPRPTKRQLVKASIREALKGPEQVS